MEKTPLNALWTLLIFIASIVLNRLETVRPQALYQNDDQSAHIIETFDSIDTLNRFR